MASAKVHHVKKARKANKNLGIKKGEEYWWWKFRYGGKNISKTDPGTDRVVRLTEYDSMMQEFNNRKESLESEFSPSEKEELENDIEDFKTELEDRLQNIPDALQESHVLNERIEEVENLLVEVNDIEGEE